MKLPKYPLASSDKLMTFEFTSEGQKGLIEKLVRFQETNVKNVYNEEILAFQDLKTGKLPTEWLRKNEQEAIYKNTG